MCGLRTRGLQSAESRSELQIVRVRQFEVGETFVNVR